MTDPAQRPSGGASFIGDALVLQLRRALRVLRNAQLAPDEVHAARKAIKKARATLRLLRTAHGDAYYRYANSALRDVAQPLSEVRDANVLEGTLAALVRRDHRDIARRGLAPLQNALSHERLVEERALSSEAVEKLRDGLRAVIERTCELPRTTAGKAAITIDLRRTYRRARGGWKRAPSASSRKLHEWRKQVKYLWHQVEVLEHPSTVTLKTLVRRLHRLADVLGEDHDLFVLADFALRHRALLEQKRAYRALQRAVRRRRKRLQKRAIALGQKAFVRKPKDFVRYWEFTPPAAGTMRPRPRQ